jgi:capsule polysaccharide export protein KpsE/RkpR
MTFGLLFVKHSAKSLVELNLGKISLLSSCRTRSQAVTDVVKVANFLKTVTCLENLDKNNRSDTKNFI